MARKTKINPVIPECVADLKGYPLYIIVAYWGLRNNKTLTTTDVSRNFLITQQQSYDCAYLHLPGSTEADNSN